MPRPKNIRYLDEDFEYQEGLAIERNGNLTLVEKCDGTVDWLAPFEIDKSNRD
jgi:hypothetical protein